MIPNPFWPGLPRRRATTAVVLSVLAGLGGAVRGQVPINPGTVTAPSPGVPNVSRTAGQLLCGPIMPQGGRLTILNYHNGILFSSPESVESESAVVNGVLKTPTGDYGTYTGYAWDLNQILASPGVLPTPLAAFPGMYNGYNAHGSMHYNAATGSDALIAPNYLRAGAFGTVSMVASAMPPGHSQSVRGNMFPPFTFSTWWVTYGPMSGLARFSRNGVTLVEWDHLARAGTMDQGVLFGNFLIFMSTGSNRGVAVYDMRNQLDGNGANDGTEPPLVGLLTEGGFGGYWPEITGWQGRLYAVGGNRGLKVVELTDFNDPKLIANNAYGGSHAVYPTFQDQFVFSGGRKVDIAQPGAPVVLTLDANAVHTVPGIGTSPTPGATGYVAPGTFGRGFEFSQFNLPLGNLVITGGLGSKQAMAIWAHQAAPDTKGPEIGFHVPRAGETNYPVAAPLSFAIPETLDMASFKTKGMTDSESEMAIIVRPLGGSPIPCTIARSSGAVVTVTPVASLAANTTYEVVFPAGRLKDAAGNGIATSYTYTFSTGTTVSGNQPPAFQGVTVSPTPVSVNGTATITASATDAPGDTLEYRINFGDGTTTAWAAGNVWTRSYATRGHFQVTVQARDQLGAISSRQAVVTVGDAPANALPSASSQLGKHPTNGRIYVVNPDNDSVSVINPATHAREATIPLAAAGTKVDPRSLAFDSAGRVWVTGFRSDALYLLDPANNHAVQTIPLAYGTAPFGICMNPAGTQAFVSYHGRGEVARFTTANPTTAPTVRVLGPGPRALAMNGAGTRLFVTRFISHDQNYGEVWEVSPSAMTLTRTIRLAMETNEWAADDAMGGPNYLASIVINPQDTHAYVTAKKDVFTAGPLFGLGDLDLLPDRTVRTTVRCISLATNAEVTNRRIDLDNSDSPSAAAFSPLGDYLFVAQQGNNLVTILDHFAIENGAVNLGSMVGRLETGLAPQAVLIDAPSNRLYVHNFMGRTVRVFDLSPLTAQGTAGLGELATVPTLPDAGAEAEKLPANVLFGKQLFYNASAVDAEGRNAMSGETYLSCASCHIDGGHDGRTWDFTSRGEGLRNTTDLRGRRGTAHGNVHWSANFDEVQDFVHDIRSRFAGTGFLAQGQQPNPSLGTPNAGTATPINGMDPLDALADYVTSLRSDTVPRSPFRAGNGTLTTDAVAGQAIFTGQSCQTCHDPASGYTNSSLGANATLADVGTLRWTSGGRLGGILSGIDTPTLAGVWDTPPYFHDGSAKTLDDVFVVAGGVAYQAEKGVFSATGVRREDYVFINGGNAGFGSYASLSTNGATVTFNNVDGGGGGTGMIEMRVANGATATRPATLTVNGTTYAVTIPALNAGSNWSTVRVDGIPLNAGATNTVVFASTSSNSVGLDQIVVSRAGDLAKAEPHRRVRNLTSTQRTQLLSYLRQLDGQNLSDTSVPKAAAGPTAAPDSFTITESVPTSLDVLANDQGQGLTIGQVGATSLGTTRVVNNQIEYSPLAAVWSGAETFTYSTRDASGLTGSSTASVSIVQAPGSGPLPPALFPTIVKLGSANTDSTNTRVRGSDGFYNLTTTSAAGINGDGTALDSILFAAKTQEGNFRATIRVRQIAGGSTARAGLMLRDTRRREARYAYVGGGIGAGYFSRSRSAGPLVGGSVEIAAAAGAADVSPDRWLMIERVGDQVRLGVSGNGADFTIVDTVTLAGLGYYTQVGLFAFAGTNGTPTDARFSDYAIEALAGAADLTTGLMARYEFDDATNLGKDTSGNGRNGAVVGTIAANTDVKVGARSARFADTDGNYITVPPDAGLALSSYTLSAWMKRSNAAGTAIGSGNSDLLGVSAFGNGQGIQWEGASNGANAHFVSQNPLTLGSSTFWNASTALNYGNVPFSGMTGQVWYHLTMVVDNAAKQVRHYINGDLNLVATFDPNVVPALIKTGSLRIGWSDYTNNGGTLRGWLDDLRIYSRPLTGAEIGVLAGVANLDPPPPAVPQITSPSSATGLAGNAFLYIITATNQPNVFTAAGLPPGLSANASNGQITGTPTETGVWNATITAANATGAAEAPLQITISSAAPAITSAGTASGAVGQAFAYAITATNHPTGYAAGNLPPGLALDAQTGVISGTPQAAGTTAISLQAVNAVGAGSATLTLVVDPTLDLAAGLSATNFGGATGSSRVPASGVWQISGSGVGLGGTADAFRFQSQQVTGDFRVTVRVRALDGRGGAAPRAGVLLRERTGVAATRFVALTADAATGYRFRSRSVEGGNATSETQPTNSASFPNKWLRLETRGATTRLLVSTDGIAFAEINGSPITLSGLSDPLDVGLMVASGSVGVEAVAEFSDYAIETLPAIQPDVTGGQIARWNFEEPSGTTALDTSGNATVLNGTLMNNPTRSTTQKRIGNAALNFNAASHYVTVSHNAALSLTANLTAAAWVRIPNTIDAEPRMILSKKSGTAGTSSGYEFFYTASSGTLSFRGRGNTTAAATASLTTGWHHVTAAVSGTTVTFYVDGASVGSGTIQQPTTNTTALNLGRRPTSAGDAYWSGYLDDVRLYNRTLTAAEIAVVASGNYGQATEPRPERPEILAVSPPTVFAGVGFTHAFNASSGASPYAWSLAAGALPSGVSLNASNGVISGSPATPGSYGFTLRVTDAGGQSDEEPFTLSVQAAAGSYIAWKDGYSWPSEANAVPGADPDRDGLANVVEWVAGSHPLQARSAATPRAELGANELILTYRLRRNLTGVAVGVESSANLRTWTLETGLAPELVAGQSDAETDLWRVRKPVANGGAPLFLRLRINAQ